MKDRYLLKLSIITLILSIIGVIIILNKLDFNIEFNELSFGILGSIIGVFISFLFSIFLRNRKLKKVLITYTSSDNQEAMLIKNYLIDHKIATNTIDEYITIGSPINNIKSIIKNSDIILILVSKDIYKSKYNKNIISLAIRERKKILPIVIDESKLPNNLGNYAYIDVRNKQEYGLKELYEKIISL